MKFCCIAGIAAFGALIGCGENPDGSVIMGRVGSPAWFASASQETIVAHYKSVCTSYGFVDGTSEMAGCIQQELGGDRSDSRQRMAAAAANINPPTVQCRTSGTANPIGRSTLYNGTTTCR